MQHETFRSPFPAQSDDQSKASSPVKETANRHWGPGLGSAPKVVGANGSCAAGKPIRTQRVVRRVGSWARGVGLRGSWVVVKPGGDRHGTERRGLGDGPGRAAGPWGTGLDGQQDLGGRPWTDGGALGNGPEPAVGPWGMGLDLLRGPGDRPRRAEGPGGWAQVAR